MFIAVSSPAENSHHLLALLLEWLTELQRPLQDSLRAVLGDVTGSSKTGKLAKSLLKL